MSRYGPGETDFRWGSETKGIFVSTASRPGCCGEAVGGRGERWKDRHFGGGGRRGSVTCAERMERMVGGRVRGLADADEQRVGLNRRVYSL